MKSTGEVMGIDSDFGRAYAKAQIEAGNTLPTRGTVLVSVRHDDNAAIGQSVLELARNGFRVLATRGTGAHLESLGIRVETVAKVGQGSPNTVDRIESGDVDLVINTVDADPKAAQDSLSMRRAALMRGVPYFTTVAGVRAATGGIRAMQAESIGVRSLQEIHST
jgi:carbamoyl-phosphate synthase large subunit